MAEENIKTVYDERGNPIKVNADQFERATESVNQSTVNQPVPQVVYMASTA